MLGVSEAAGAFTATSVLFAEAGSTAAEIQTSARGSYIVHTLTMLTCSA